MGKDAAVQKLIDKLWYAPDKWGHTSDPDTLTLRSIKIVIEEPDHCKVYVRDKEVTLTNQQTYKIFEASMFCLKTKYDERAALEIEVEHLFDSIIR